MTLRRGRILFAIVSVGAVLLFSLPLSAAEDEDRFGPIDWSEMAPLAPKALFADATISGTRIVAVGERGHVLVSEDRGATWVQARVPTRKLLNAVTTIDGQRIWAVGHDAVIIHSQDAGKTWVRQYCAPEEEKPLLDVWFEDEKHGIAIGAYAIFLETRDGGATWEERSVDEEERHWNGIAQSRDGTLYVAAEYGAVFRSSDKGETWELLQTSYAGSFLGVLCLPDGTILAFGLRGNVYRSTDRGESWQDIPTDTTVTLMGGSQGSDGTVAIVGLSGTVLLSRDSGASFRFFNRPDRKALSAVIESKPGDLIFFGEHGVSLGEGVSTPPSS